MQPLYTLPIRATLFSAVGYATSGLITAWATHLLASQPGSSIDRKEMHDE